MLAGVRAYHGLDGFVGEPRGSTWSQEEQGSGSYGYAPGVQPYGTGNVSMIAAGRRAGQQKEVVEPLPLPSGPSNSYGSFDSGPRYGRRASPTAPPSGTGMEYEPRPPSVASRPTSIPALSAGSAANLAPRAAPLPATPPHLLGRPAPIPGGAMAPTGGPPGTANGASAKLAGLARLKEAQNARLAGRLPSAGPERDDSGYVPSAAYGAAPARPAMPPALAGGARPGHRPAAAAAAPPTPPQPASMGRASAMPPALAKPSYAPQPPAAAPLAAAPTAPIRVAAPPPALKPAPPPAVASRNPLAGLFGGATAPPGVPVGPSAASATPPGADSAPTGPMIQCKTCGRTFAQSAYAKHAKVCDKVFAQKRKPMNMAQKRLEGTEAAKFYDTKKGAKPGAAKAGAGAAAKAAAAKPAGAAGGKAKWKAQSEQLRAAMMANKKIEAAKAQGIDLRNVDFGDVPQVDDDRVPCPYCGRKFAQDTADRHIPKCKDIQANKPRRR